MQIETRDFGKMEIDEKDIIIFRQPIYGFEHLSKYVFLYDEEMQHNFVWLQSLEDADICFILADPQALGIDYQPRIPQSLEQLLGKEDLICWCVVTFPQDFEKATVNLKSPVLVNPMRRTGAQVILEGSYQVRYPLVEKGEALC